MQRMDIERRRTLATTATALLPGVEQAVVDSWPDLLPAAAGWAPDAVARARAAVRAALDGIVAIIAQSDLDDRSWMQVRAVVSGHGHATLDEVRDLLRTVRVVGVDLLATRLDELVGLSEDERWELQTQAGWFADQLIGDFDDLEGAAEDAHLLHLLAEGGPDLG